MVDLYWIHANYTGRAEWHLVVADDDEVRFVTLDDFSEEMSIADYVVEFPHNTVVGPLLRPSDRCTCDENMDDPCVMHTRDYQPGKALVTMGAYQRLVKHFDQAQHTIAQLHQQFQKVIAWSAQYGKDLCPKSGYADSYGEGMRAAKERVRALLHARSSVKCLTCGADPSIAGQHCICDPGVGGGTDER